MTSNLMLSNFIFIRIDGRGLAAKNACVRMGAGTVKVTMPPITAVSIAVQPLH